MELLNASSLAFTWIGNQQSARSRIKVHLIRGNTPLYIDIVHCFAIQWASR